MKYDVEIRKLLKFVVTTMYRMQHCKTGTLTLLHLFLKTKFNNGTYMFQLQSISPFNIENSQMVFIKFFFVFLRINLNRKNVLISFIEFLRWLNSQLNL